MFAPTRRRAARWVGAGAAALLAVAVAAPAASAQTPFDQATFDAYATGTAVHVSGLTQGSVADGGTRVLNADVAFSGATTDTGGLADAQSNEMGVQVQPAEQGKNAYGRGSGLELGGGVDVPGAVNQAILASKAEAAAPPSTDLVTEEAGPVPGAPLAYASLLRGQAQATYDPGSCPLSGDLSYGLGYAANAQLLSQNQQANDDDSLQQPVVAADAPNPDRAVSQTLSRNYLAPQVDKDGNTVGNANGLTSEVRETIAPVTFFKGTANEFTVEVLGEWVLQAHATGVPGTGFVHYGPADTSPSTPVVRVIQNGQVAGQLTTQDIAGGEGQVIDLGDGNGTSLAKIKIGEDPRAIGGNADTSPAITADGTSVAAAVDVVDVELLTVAGVGQGANVRIGHMETSATVPAGGIECEQVGIPVSKTASADTVQPGDPVTYTITVDNPFDCRLTGVKVVDTLSGDEGVTWSVTSSDPKADDSSDTKVTWNDIGPIEKGGSKSVDLTVTVGDDSAAGLLHDTATVTASCDTRPLTGQTTVNVPKVVTQETAPAEANRAPSAPALPRTGGGLAALGLSVMGAAGTLWKRRR